MPFNTNAPSTLMRLIYNVLRKYMRKHVVVYIDDINFGMNPTTDHFHVPERAITRSNTKKIQESNQENNGVADIGK